MASVGGAVTIVDDDGTSLVVTLSDVTGAAVTVYTNEALSSSIAMPATITAATTFWVPRDGTYTLSITESGIQVADTPDASRTVTLSGGKRVVIKPTLDQGRLPDLSGTYARRDYVEDQINKYPRRLVTLIGGQEDEATPTGFNATIAADTTHADLGAQGWQVTANQAGASTPQLRYTPAVAPSFTGGAVVGCRVYIPDVTQITLIGLTLNKATGTAWTRSSSSVPTPLVNGWNTLRWHAATADVTNWGSTTRVDVFGSATATGATFTVGRVWVEVPPKASLLFIHDGGYKDFLNNAYPLLKARGVPVTFAIDPTALGTGTGNAARMTEADVAQVAADGNGNRISFHSYDGSPTSSMTAAQIRADTMKAIKWLQARGYKGGIWRPAYVQDQATNYTAAKPLLLASTTYKSDSGTSAWPPQDRYNMTRFGVYNGSGGTRTTAEVDAHFATLQNCHALSLLYVHDVSDSPGAFGCSTALFADVLSNIDAGFSGGWLEAVTFETLFARSGGKFRTDLSGRVTAEFYDETGAEVRQLLP